MEKVKNLMRNDKFQYLMIFLIILFGLYLRVIGLNKPDGLWFDEAFSFYDANQSFPFGILNKLYTEDGHAPLYFFVLHFWTGLCGMHDTVLRLLSVVIGVIALPVFYVAGKELFNKKTAFLVLALASINSLLIYYSQEVRHYSLQVLLGVLSVLFLTRVNNAPNKKNYLGLILTNTAILYTYTIGFIFVFFQTLFFGFYLYFKKRSIKNYIISQTIVGLIYLPYLFILIHQLSFFSKTFINPFDLFYFNYANILLIFQNWFTPVLDGLINVNPGYYKVIFANFNLLFILFAVIPVIICLIGLVKAISKRSFINVLLMIACFYIFVEIIATSLGKFNLLAKYTLFAFPTVIIAVSYGLTCIKNVHLSRLLISLLIGINLFFLAIYPFSAPKMPRPEAFRTVAKIMDKYSFNSKDIIFMPSGGRFLSKYYSSQKGKMIPFFFYDAFMLNNKQHLKAIFDNQLADNLNRQNARDNLRYYIGSSNINKTFKDYFKANILDKLDNDRYFVFIITRGIAFLDKDTLKTITDYDEYYKDKSLFFMLSSKITNDTLEMSYKYLKPVVVERSGVWEIYIFKK